MRVLMSWIAGLGVNFLVPLLGLIAFLLLCRTMRRTRVPSPAFVSYFLLFAILGGWLMVFLTGLFWVWSGMASRGIAFLLVVAPFLTAGIAIGLRKRRNLSPFHRSAYVANIADNCLPLPALGWLFWDSIPGSSGIFSKFESYR
jgi:hypothetical protein